MMNLVIDIGNTRTKFAVCNHNELIQVEIISNLNFLNTIKSLIEKHRCKQAIVSSVRKDNIHLINQIKSEINLLELNFNTPIPFHNQYKSPQTLGTDRIALVAAAVSKFPKTDVLVIDAGSCITYDFVNSNSVYLGGVISPGIKMRYKAMHSFTENLPLLEVEENESFIGNTTASCMHIGVINGVISEINVTIDTYKNKYQHLTVVLTGGDVNFLSNKLKNSIFATPNFLLEGLNTILTYNLK